MRKLAYLLISFAAAAVMIACGVHWYTSREQLPPEIRIAAGKSGGLYDKLAHDIKERSQKRVGRGVSVSVIETAGTDENIGHLRNGAADLALIQTNSSTPKDLAGIAPLYPEILHVIARRGSDIRSLKNLESRRVALGLKGSSMRKVSHAVLTHYGVKNVQDKEEYFGVLDTDSGLDAALVTTGWMNPTLEKLLQSGDFELLHIDDPDGLAMRYPFFTATTIPRGLYPGKSPVPPEPVRTLAVTALLVGRSDAPDRLVRESLAALYESDLRTNFPAMLSAKAAKDYDAAVMHPAVANYHDPVAGLNRLSKAFEFIAKSKEALFGVVAFALVFWGLVRRWRERVADAADQEQKQKLDDFINRTLKVEEDQMEVTDPEQLRPFLRHVTTIKKEALRELTSEKVRGDQLFAIFLSQCAALSEKIQMRMLYGRIREADQEMVVSPGAPEHEEHPRG